MVGEEEQSGVINLKDKKIFNLDEIGDSGSLSDSLAVLSEKPGESLSGLVNVKKMAAKIYFDVFEGLLSYCTIPKNFEHCRLEISTLNLDNLDREQRLKIVECPTGIIYNPNLAHYKAVKFFKKLLAGDSKICQDSDPLRPKWGAYLVGPPGTGKTHLMTAYAIELKKLLNSRLSEVKSFLEQRINEEALKLMKSGAFSDIEFKPKHDSETGKLDTLVVERGKEEIEKLTKYLKTEIRRYKYKPTDVVYITLNNLAEMHFSENETKKATLTALINSPVVFIDDINPKEKKDANSLGAVIEERYNSGNFATFLTSNIFASQSIGDMYEDQTIGERIKGRLAEMVYQIDFKECGNWRENVNQLKIEDINDEILAELKEEGIVQG